MQKRIGTILVFSALGLLAACGGGGGGGGGGDSAQDNYKGSTARVAVTDDNDAGRVASNTYRAAAAIDFTTVTGRAAMSRSVESPVLSDIGNVLKRQRARLLAKAENCPDGGTLDGNRSGDGTAGSTSHITYTNCRIGNLLINGSTTGRVNSGDINTDDYSATATFDHYNVKFLSDSGSPTGNYFEMHGDITVTMSSSGSSYTAVVSGDAFYVAVVDSASGVNAKTLLENFKSTVIENSATLEVSSRFDYTLSSTLLGGSVVVHTVTPFVTPAGQIYPQSGQVVITAADNVKVRLTADGEALSDVDHVTIEWDLDADGTYEGSLSTHWGVPWYS